MQKSKRFLSFILCFAIMICSCVLTVAAEDKTANVIGTSIAIRTEPNTTSSTVLARVSNVAVTVHSSTEGEQAEAGGTKTWYYVTYGGYTGYIYGAYISFPPSSDDYVYDENFEKNLLNFPESYRDALRALHSKYPNWQFVAHNVGLSFKSAVESQYGVLNVKDTRKWVEFTYGGNEWRDMRGYDSSTDSWITLESRWTYASRAAIEYFMDPRNSLDESKVFVFAQQSYNADTQTKENLRSVAKGTFLEYGYDTNGDGIAEADAYLDDIMSAAKKSGVSPYVLAATIIVEQGSAGNTNMVSGTYAGYEGYYNFFNYNASGSTTDEITVSALDYAKSAGWNSRTAAIEGGAQKYADGYIDVGQDTYYYKDFNVVNQIWWHQYASALYDAWTNANYLKKGCLTNADATLTFTIPVYTDMPGSACALPSVSSGSNGSGNTGSGTATPTPTPTPEPVIKKGDISGDGKISIVDLAALKRHMLDVKKLEGDAIKAADVNGDGNVSIIDLAAIKRHLLGVKTIE